MVRTTIRKQVDIGRKRWEREQYLKEVETRQRKQFTLMIRRYNCPFWGRRAALRDWRAAMDKIQIDSESASSSSAEDSDSDEDSYSEFKSNPELAVIPAPFLQDSAHLSPLSIGPQTRLFMEGLTGLRKFTETVFHLTRMLRLARRAPGVAMVQGGAIVVRNF